MGRPRLIGPALLLVGLLLAYLGGWPLTCGVVLMSLVALLELRWATGRCKLRLSLEIGYAVSVAYIFAAHWFADDPENLGMAVLALTVFLIIVDLALHLHHGVAAPTSNVSLTAFACLWCGLLMSCLVLLRGYQPELTADCLLGDDWPFGRRLLLYVVLVTLVADAAALGVDALVGRRNLTETVVAHRTWEGCAAAIVAAVLAALLFGAVLRIEATIAAGLSPEQVTWLSLRHRLMLGLLIGVCGRIGDFGASIFRHDAQVACFSVFAADRPGVLDRCASLLLTAPAVYLYAHLML